MTVHGQASLNLEELPCACLKTSKEGLIIFANGYFLENYGWDFNALKAAGTEALFSKASLVFCASYVYPKALAETTCVEVQLTVFTGDKQRKTVIVSVKQLPDGGFAWVLMEAENRASLFQELSDAKDALIDQSTELNNLNRTLEQTSAKMSAILDNAHEGIITIDIKGLITSFNIAAQELFGYSADQVVGQHVSILLPTQNSNRKLLYITAFLNARMPSMIGRRTELEARRADGGVFPAELAVSSSTDKNEISFIGIVRDLTQRRRIDQLKSDFLATVSHELRTPLVSVQGTLAFVKAGAFGDLDAIGQKMIARALSNAESLGGMIDEILDSEKLSSGELEVNIEQVALTDILRCTKDTIQAYADKFSIKLDFGESFQAPRVLADPSRAVQVLTNIISNAVKFSPADGLVRIEVRPGNKFVRVAVIDNGPGIPKDKHHMVFQKFLQIDASTPGMHRGTGLGLTISHGLMKRMEGKIGFISEEGAGSTFWAEFRISAETKHRPQYESEIEQ
jgi:PAS domain S-box-containing protein